MALKAIVDAVTNLIPTNADSVYGIKGGNSVSIDEIQGIYNGEIFSIWKKNKYYYITFHANSGTGSMAKQTMPCGTAAALSANLFSKVGYLFQGWNPDASGDAVYTDGQKVTDIAGAGETLPLYAIWKAITYYVGYNANGGSGSMANQDFKYDTAENLNSNAFSRTGYLFAGWDADGDGDVDYGDGASVKNLLSVNGGTVNFYAVWKAITWYVKFNANGGSGSMKNQTHTYDTELALTKNAFTRTNHKFLGWGTAPSGGVVYADQAAVKNLKSAHGAIQNLYAIWKETTRYLFANGAYQVSTAAHQISYAYNVGNANTAAGYMKVETDNASVAGGQHITTYRITGLVDISDFKKVIANYTVGTGSYVPESTRMWLSVHSADPGDVYQGSGNHLNDYSCVKSAYQTGGSSVSLDISGLSGSYYLVIGCEYHFNAGVCLTAEATLSNWYLSGE